MPSQTSLFSAANAMYLAEDLHADQLDHDGTPHYLHLTRVAAMVPEDHQAVAWLHDVLEDTGETAVDLMDRGVPGDVLAALRLLTRGGDESYDAFTRRIARAPGLAGAMARRVKEADMLDNLTRCLRAAADDKKAKSLENRYRMYLPRIQQAMVGR